MVLVICVLHEPITVKAGILKIIFYEKTIAATELWCILQYIVLFIYGFDSPYSLIS